MFGAFKFGQGMFGEPKGGAGDAYAHQLQLTISLRSVAALAPVLPGGSSGLGRHLRYLGRREPALPVVIHGDVVISKGFRLGLSLRKVKAGAGASAQAHGARLKVRKGEVLVRATYEESETDVGPVTIQTRNDHGRPDTFEAMLLAALIALEEEENLTTTTKG